MIRSVRFLRRRRDRNDLHAVCDRMRAAHPLLTNMTDEQLVRAHLRMMRGARDAGLTVSEVTEGMRRIASALSA